MAPGSHASYTHICTAILEMLLSRGVSNRRAVGSFICFTCAARARSSAAHCVVMGSHSLHTERPPCWEFVLVPFVPRARKLGSALVCNELQLGLKRRSQLLDLVFGLCAPRSAAHVVVISSSSGSKKMVTVFVALGCASGCNEFLF